MTADITTLPSRCRAWTWQVAGAPETLQLAEIALPVPAAGEVLLKNRAIGLNPVDWKMTANAASGWQAGKIPGVDGAGIVVAAQDPQDAHWLGRRVAYHQDLQKNGSFAEYTAVPARALMALPDSIGFDTAASFPCPALTALTALDKIPLQYGAPLLVSGAGGAVGHYFIQLARARGFAVTAMSHPRHREKLLALGADSVLEGPLGEKDALPERLLRHFFAVVDTVSPEHAARLMAALCVNGHLVCVRGRVTQPPAETPTRALSLHEVALGALHRHGSAEQWQQLTRAGETMLANMAIGRLLPETLVLDNFAHLPQLLGRLQKRDFSGKPVVAL